MEMIAPQARDLAEQNGIDWRNIRGTGAGGQIVEADILGYLTRLMFGEEELPSTPVDLPPPDWEGDVASLSMNAQSLTAAGIDSDITDFITQQRDSVPAAPAVTNDAPTETNEDALDFELELDEEVAEPASLSTPPAVAASHEAFEDDFGDLDVSTPASPAFVASEPAEPAAPAAPAIAGGLLSSLYGRSATPQPEPVQPPVSQPEPVEVEVEPEVEVAAEAQPEPVFTAPAEVEPTEVQFTEIEVTEVEPVVAAVPVAEAQPEVAPVQPVMAESVIAAPIAAEVQPEVAPVAPAHHEPATAPVVPTVTAPPAVLAAPAATSAHAVMRLAFDADALLSASAALAEHFGRPAPLAVFVARAAARHVGTLGLSGVGVYGTGEDTAPVATPSLTGDFRAAVADLTRGDAGTASDLMVIDAGELGLDELHLPGAGVTLALGRVREGQATLTLTGPVAIRSGAAFVQAVADLLETPIRLMI